MSSCIALAESLDMFNIVKLTLFFLLITQVNCIWNPFANFHPFKRITAWFHRIWNPFDTYRIDGDSRTTVDFINGTTVVTAKIGGHKYRATFPKEEIVGTETYYLINRNGTQTEKVEITVGDQTYVYKTVDGKTTVTDGQGKRFRGDDPFHVNTNNVVNTTSKPTTGGSY
ncbi:hypothetical protein GCK32_020881 [Trichostrongylus colubriformis]|uniref:Uncharacterized protein n=1 Tax=Trichostrongylus colubriformis TaxID=6319 RepID=A0AAN8FEP5_TRICO